MNRYSNIRPTDLNLPVITLPLEQLNNNLVRTQQLYDSSKSISNVPIQYIQDNTEHSNAAAELRKQLDAVSNEVAKRYTEGNVEEANKYALSTIRNVGKEFSQGGRGYALADAYANYNKGLKSIYEVNKDTPGGDINTAVAVDEYKKGIKGLEYQDGLGYTHNVSSEPRAYKYFNRSKALYEAVKQFDPDVTEQDFIGLMDQNGNLDTKNQAWISRLKTKGYTSERINNIFNSIASDPAWVQQSVVEAKYKVLSQGEDVSKNQALAYFEKKTEAMTSILDFYRDKNRGEFKLALNEIGIDTKDKNDRELDIAYAEWKQAKKDGLMSEAGNRSAVELLVDADYDMQKSKFSNLLPKEKSLNYLTNQVYENERQRAFTREENAKKLKNDKDIVRMQIEAAKQESMPLFINGGLVDVATDPKAYTNALDNIARWEKGDADLSNRLWQSLNSSAPKTGKNEIESEIIAAMNNSTDNASFKANLSKSSNPYVNSNAATLATRYEALKIPINERNNLEKSYLESKELVSQASSNIDASKVKSNSDFKNMYSYWKNHNKGKTFEQFMEEGRKGNLKPEHFKSLDGSLTYSKNPNETFNKHSQKYFQDNPEDFKYSRNTFIIGDANTDSKLGKMVKSFTETIANTWTTRTQKGRSIAGVFVDREGNTIEPEYWKPVYSAPNDNGEISIVLQNKKTDKQTTIELETTDADRGTIDIMLSNARAEAADRGDLNSYIQISAGMAPMPNEGVARNARYYSGSDGKNRGIYNANNLSGSIVHGYQTVYNGNNDWSLVIDKNGNYYVGKERNINNQKAFMATGVEAVNSTGLVQSNTYFTTKDFKKAKNMIQTLEANDNFQFKVTTK